jgi:hypothetical protein
MFTQFFTLCGADLMSAVVGLATGLDEVEMVVKMAIKGKNVYSEVSNALLGWEQHNYFASGVNVAKVLNELLAVTELQDPVARGVALASTTSTKIARRPSGAWVNCEDIAAHARHVFTCLHVDRALR